MSPAPQDFFMCSLFRKCYTNQTLKLNYQQNCECVLVKAELHKIAFGKITMTVWYYQGKRIKILLVNHQGAYVEATVILKLNQCFFPKSWCILISGRLFCYFFGEQKSKDQKTIEKNVYSINELNVIVQIC